MSRSKFAIVGIPLIVFVSLAAGHGCSSSSSTLTDAANNGSGGIAGGGTGGSFGSSGGISGGSGGVGTGGETVGSGGMSGGTGGESIVDAADAKGMPDSETVDMSIEKGGATEAACPMKAAMTDPPLAVAAFCTALLADCKTHLLAAYNTMAKCAAAFAKAKDPSCQTYHLCWGVGEMKMPVPHCGHAQGAAPCNI